MPGSSPSPRLHELLAAAAAVFGTHGYHRAQMAEVARAAGVAPGTLYLYFESKEALFYTVLRHALAPGAFAAPADLPVTTPSPEAFPALLHAHRRSWRLQSPSSALAHHHVQDVRPELQQIVRELYRLVWQQRTAVRILTRSALDWPALFDLYLTTMRGRVEMQLTRYLERRVSQGLAYPVPDTAGAVRLIVETVCWFAVDRPTSADAEAISDELAEETVVQLLANAFARS